MALTGTWLSRPERYEGGHLHRASLSHHDQRSLLQVNYAAGGLTVGTRQRRPRHNYPGYVIVAHSQRVRRLRYELAEGVTLSPSARPIADVKAAAAAASARCSAATAAAGHSQQARGVI
jgi:hypothetical protein